MSNIRRKKKKQQESIVTSLKQFFGYLLDWMICIYMFLIIVVMPFYNEQGYAYIGTNKAMFFRNISINGAKFILPTIVLYLIFAGVERRKSLADTRIKEGAKTNDVTGLNGGFRIAGVHLSITDGFALLYGASLLLSYACSDYQELAFWGAAGWYMGLVPQLFLLGIYFMISRFWNRRNWMCLLFLPVSAVVFALGYLNRFGIYPIDMGLKDRGYLSTIGNINWYCGYLVAVFFGGYYLLWQGGRMQGAQMNNHRDSAKTKALEWGGRILLAIYVAIGFATLVTQGSLSGMLALAVILIVAFCLSARDGKLMYHFWLGNLILSLVCVATWCLQNMCGWKSNYGEPIVFLLTDSYFPMFTAGFSVICMLAIGLLNRYGKYPKKFFGWMAWIIGGGAALGVCAVIGMIAVNTIHPGNIGGLSDHSFFTFSDTWGSSRGVTWKAGWMCFAEQDWLHKIIGVGPDAMEGYLGHGASSELSSLVTGNFGTSRLTNAHCEWLTILVDTGLLGFVGFVGMMVSAMVRFLKNGRTDVLAGACGLCLLAYTVNNMFSFQQSMNVATIFVILGIGEAYAKACASFAKTL